jgi:hypothetical protein
VISAPYADGFNNNDDASGEIVITFGKRKARPDTRGPLVIDTAPANNSINVLLNESIVAIFDESVVPGSFKFQCEPDPGSWQVSWNSTFQMATLSHSNFTEKLLYIFDVLEANDSLNNNFNKTFWHSIRFYTGDFKPPSIITAEPSENAQAVNPYANITITFSEEIQPQTLQYNCTPDPGGWLQPEWDPTLTQLSLKHSIPFQELTEYTFEIEAADDTYYNHISPSDKPIKWKFTTGKKDPVPPFIVSTVPADKSSGIEVSTYIEFQFSEAMNKSTVNDSFEIAPAPVIDSLEWLSNKSLRIRTAWNLLPSTAYTITLKTSAKDLAGNDLDGNGNGIIDGSPLDDFKWSFTTGISGDIKPPTINEVRPLRDQTDVKLNRIIEIRFSEVMNQSSVANAFEISPPINGTFYPFHYYTTFIPADEFIPATTYQVKVKGNAKDMSGNAFDGDFDGIPEGEETDIYTWKFTTAGQGVRDDDVPYVVRTLPEPDAEGVSINTQIEIEFSENMSWAMAGDSLGVTPSVLGAFIWNSTKLIFQPYSNLELDVIYTVKISAMARDLSSKFLDGNGNGIIEGSPADDYIFSFRTGLLSDQIPPIIQSTHPKNNDIDVSRNARIEITFSESMIKDVTENAFIISPATKGEFQWQDNILGFKPDPVLEPNEKYTVTIKNTARDLAGNYLDGNRDGIGANGDVDDYSFSFSSSQDYDTTSPQVIFTQPENGSIDVKLSSAIIINFSEPMNKIYFTNAFHITPLIRGTFFWVDTTMEFIPLLSMESYTTYTVTITTQAEDLAGNPLDGNSNGVFDDPEADIYIFSFRTENITTIEDGPKLINVEPAPSSEKIKLNQPIILEFDIPMNPDPQLLMFNCSPNPGGWELTWSEDAMVATLSHKDFDFSTEYTFTIIYARGQNDITLVEGPVPTSWKFKTVSEISDNGVVDGEYTIGGLNIDSQTLLTILFIIFVWVLVIILIAVVTLIRLKHKKDKAEEDKEEEKEKAGEEEEEVLITEEEEKDAEEVEKEEELEEEPQEDEEIEKIVIEDVELESESAIQLEELPPPPEETVPTIEVDNGKNQNNKNNSG